VGALLITYDLDKPGQKYTGLHEAIKSLGTWWHYLESTWIVVSSQTPGQASDTLTTHIDANDNVLVIDVTNDRYAGWLSQDAWDWLKRHI
jgi:hypothetical protein